MTNNIKIYVLYDCINCIKKRFGEKFVVSVVYWSLVRVICAFLIYYIEIKCVEFEFTK